MKKPALVGALALVVVSLSCLATPPAVAQWSPVTVDALEPASTGGLPRLIRLIDRLDTHRRVLVIGAHPDDEDTSLLAVTALGDGGESAYLSLSRGDGGQNLIGPELGVGLGLIRSQELVSARRVDGARQFFTRAYDFGYSRSVEEALRFWPREELLADAVRVVRRFRPQLIVSIFPADPRAGHGQHEAAGVIAGEVFEAAADPARFPSQLEEGLAPWQADRFFRSAWFNRREGDIDVPLGQIDPLTGKSFAQLAMASRSQHRSQDMGVEQRLGPRSTALAWEKGGESAPQTPFEGLDTTLLALSGFESDYSVRQKVNALLREAQRSIAQAREATAAGEMARAAAPLRSALGALADAAEMAHSTSTRELLGEKMLLASEAILVAKGLVLDAVAGRAEVVEGGPALEVEGQLYNQSSAPIEARVTLAGSQGWDVPSEPSVLEAQVGELATAMIEAGVRDQAPATQPYFLAEGVGAAPGDPALYRWPLGRRDLWGLPFEPPALMARFEVTLPDLDEPLVVEREVVHRYRNPAFGEVRRPLRAVPLLEVGVDTPLLVWPSSDRRARGVDISLRSWSDSPLQGHLEIEGPTGWTQIADTSFELPAGGQKVLTVGLPRPDPFPLGRHRFEVRAVVEASGRSYSVAYDVIDYPHIRPTVKPRRAAFEISAGDLKLPQVRSVGYFRGASDEVPEVLQSIGVPLQILDARVLLDAPDSVLDAFPVIVVGSRAYEIDPALQQLHERLISWAERGGTLVVQYQKYPFSRGGYFPFPLSITRPHGRVADETAPVVMLEPGHPVFLDPNPIGEADWLDWVQERGLYFAGSWDERYTPLLELADPGRDPERGALLIADVGEGTWVYSGLAFFRELPAGVVGATRLFLNLLALGEGEGATDGPAGN